MIKPIIYPYKLSSHTAKCLASALDTKCVRENGNYVPKQTHLIINWGNPRAPAWETEDMEYLPPNYKPVLNYWRNVGPASNKIVSFLRLEVADVSIPNWTTEKEEAKQWIADGHIVFARTLLNSHSGKGIVLLNDANTSVLGWDAFAPAPLYVQYKKKKKEFRVHVFLGEVLDVQQKKKRLDFEGEVNSYIRSHSNGWIFAREDIVEPEELRSLAIRAVEALGLDFGAVDIIWNERENKCYVLEVNTAPGLEGTTLQKYVDKIKQLCQTL